MCLAHKNVECHISNCREKIILQINEIVDVCVSNEKFACDEATTSRLSLLDCSHSFMPQISLVNSVFTVLYTCCLGIGVKSNKLIFSIPSTTSCPFKTLQLLTESKQSDVDDTFEPHNTHLGPHSPLSLMTPLQMGQHPAKWASY
ncbi:hypothetical protein BpHYR1_024774 [Brachionus plicatilis]|uniref:Uncharacterized protein n=1 Tax=Brachionus plicatilis TaxID=10195 RepID=A0A3M7S9A5_BRAPC|nr:hypothetical protein BpHYR1_024774 [Brachionus plicatilis]